MTYMVVGYSASILAEMDKFLPPASVIVLEEPEIAAARNVAGNLANFACAGDLVTARTQDEQNIGNLAAQLPRPGGVRAVIPGLEYAVVAAAALAGSWGLPGIGLPAARILRNKALLRESAQRRGMRQPQWRRAAGPADVASFREEHGGRCVLKPTKLQASVGVQLLGPHDDVGEAWEITAAADEPRLRARYAAHTSYLVEEWLHGSEISVEALVQEGEILFLNVTDKQLSGGRYPVELGHVVPATVSARANDEVRIAMADLVAAIGFRSGILHAEWILLDGHPHLIECAGRIPGDRIPLLIDLAYQASLMGAYLSLLEGDTPVLNAEPLQAAAVRFLSASPGVLRQVLGVGMASKSPGVHEVHLDVVPGAEVRPLINSWSRLGNVVAVGRDAAEAQANATTAAFLVDLVVDTEDKAPKAAASGAEGADR
jgi:biotin carboxylase